MPNFCEFSKFIIVVDTEKICYSNVKNKLFKISKILFFIHKLRPNPCYTSEDQSLCGGLSKVL